jgi:hypothetical protein
MWPAYDKRTGQEVGAVALPRWSNWDPDDLYAHGKQYFAVAVGAGVAHASLNPLDPTPGRELFRTDVRRVGCIKTARVNTYEKVEA